MFLSVYAGVGNDIFQGGCCVDSYGAGCCFAAIFRCDSDRCFTCGNGCYFTVYIHCGNLFVAALPGYVFVRSVGRGNGCFQGVSSLYRQSQFGFVERNTLYIDCRVGIFNTWVSSRIGRLFSISDSNRNIAFLVFNSILATTCIRSLINFSGNGITGFRAKGGCQFITGFYCRTGSYFCSVQCDNIAVSACRVSLFLFDSTDNNVASQSCYVYCCRSAYRCIIIICRGE